jgi:hypothetical protein
VWAGREWRNRYEVMFPQQLGADLLAHLRSGEEGRAVRASAWLYRDSVHVCAHEPQAHAGRPVMADS